MFCAGSVCTSQECCQSARQCNVDVCAMGYLLKPPSKLPPFCATFFCQEEECCIKAPRCKASVCSIGFHLKPEGMLPPLGQPVNGCKDYSCTLEECCDESPYCPESVCPGNLTLTTLNPSPFCSSFDCLPEDCCSFAGICTPSHCDIGYQLKTIDLPPWCDRPECTQAECCDVIPPQQNVSDVWFVDLDLRRRFVGGTITWAPPAPSIPNVTHYAIYMGNDLRFRTNVQNVTYGTNSFTVPPGFVAYNYLYIWTSNDGGDVNYPVVLEVTDINLTPHFLDFSDLDLDTNEVGGYISWDEMLPDFHSWEATVCRLTPGLGTSLGVEAGYGNETWGTHPSFYIDGFLVEGVVVEEEYGGSVSIVVVSSSTREVEGNATFRTKEKTEAGLLQEYLENNITDGSIVLLATWGDAARHLNKTALSFFFAATECEKLESGDSYALIGIKGHNFTLRETRVEADALVQASVEIFCPVSHYEVMYSDGVNQSREVGRILGAGNSFLLPRDTEVFGDSNLTVNAVSQQHTSQAMPHWIENHFIAMNEVTFAEDDPANLETIGGTVTWTPFGDEEFVNAYRVYIAVSADGEGRVQMGEDVPAGVNELVIERGTPRKNATHLLIYALSDIGEQSYPDATDLSDLTGQVKVTVMVALVGSVAALQMAKIMEALEKSAKRMDNKAILDIPLVGKFVSDDGDLVKIKGAGKDMVPWRGPISQLCKCVNHHAPHLKLKRSGKAQREGKRCFGLRSTVPPDIFKVKLIDTCKNAWDNDDIVLKKLSNNDIAICGMSGDVTVFHRKPIFWWRIIDGSKVCSRAAIRMYAPMICLLGVAFLIAYSGEVMLAAMLIVIALAAVGLLAIASRMACTKDVINIIHDLPPKRGREKFWGVVKTVVGCLPAAPAFLAGTTVGYLAGGLAMVGTLLSARKAYGLATVTEGFGGLAISAFAIYMKATDTSNTAAAAKLTATLMGGAMVAVKALDTQIETQERLHNKKELMVDDLVRSAEDTNSATGMGICNAVALEAFGIGHVESRMSDRLDPRDQGGCQRLGAER